MDDGRSTLLRFDEFELDSKRQELRRAGVPVRLHAQPLRLLALLASRAGEVVSREAIQDHVWPPGTHVDFDQGINAAVRQVRAALGDSADSPRFVQTVPRRGYRFVAKVEPLPTATRVPGGPPGWRGSVWATALVTALVLAAWLIVGNADPGPAKSAQRPSLVVLPFQNLGPDPERAWVGDALTEELIAQLGGKFAQRMTVIARTSSMRYRQTDKDVTEIARELGADYLLEGSVQVIDEQLRVTAQLIRAEDRSHLWAATYDRPFADLLRIEREVSDRIVRTLAVKLLPPDEREGPGPDPRAYEAFLRGRYLLDKATRASSLAALAEFDRALEIDPGFARAHVGRARAVRRTTRPPEGSRLAKQAVQRALELDPGLAEAHLFQAMTRLYSDYDLEGARASFDTALAIDPLYAEAHHNMAAYFSVQGRHDEALAAVLRAREIDPVSADVNADIGWYHYFARQYDEAIEASRRTLELEPGFYWARLCAQFAFAETGRLQEAVELARASLDGQESPTAQLVALEDEPERFMRAYWELFLAELRTASERTFIAPADFAQVQMVLGRYEEAIEALEDSYELRAGWILPFLGVHPLFDPVRSDPRFQELLARIGSAGSHVALAHR